MKQVTLCALALLALAFVVAGCRNTPSRGDRGGADSTLLADTAADSTVYGVCGEGTAMHTLELITDAGDTLRYVLGEDEDGRQDVQGGLLVGDRLAVIEGQAVDGDPTARRVINLTTLLGKWTSLDKNFEILEGGVVKSSVKAERNPWTSWKSSTASCCSTATRSASAIWAATRSIWKTAKASSSTSVRNKRRPRRRGALHGLWNHSKYIFWAAAVRCPR